MTLAVTHASNLLQWHQQHTPANMVQGESHCGIVTQSLLASVGNWVTNTLHSMTPLGSLFIITTATLCRIPSAVGSNK